FSAEPIDMKLATTKNEPSPVERELADPVESTIVQQKGVQLNLLQLSDDLFPIHSACTCGCMHSRNRIQVISMSKSRNSNLRRQDLSGGLQLAQTAQPALVVSGFVLKILGYFRMRQNQEFLIRHALYNGICDLSWFNCSIKQESAASKLRSGQHVGAHALRAQRRDAQALVAVSDAEPLGKGQRSMLAHCIRRRPDLRQQSCGRDRLQQVARFAREHLRQHSSGSVNVGHDVHFPASLPLVVRSFGTSRHADARIRAENVHLAKALICFLYQLLHVSFSGHVGYDCRTLDFCCHALSAGYINVRDHNRPGALRGELPAQRFANSIGAAGHNDYFVLNLHARKIKENSALPQRRCNPCWKGAPGYCSCNCSHNQHFRYTGLRHHTYCREAP